MRAATTWLKFAWPRDVDTDIGERLLLVLHGVADPRRRVSFVWEVQGTTDTIEHRLRLPTDVASQAESQLRHVVPGLGVEEIPEPDIKVSQGWRIWLSSSRRPLNHEKPELIATGLLSALAGAEGNEAIILQWHLGPVRRPRRVPNAMPGEHTERWTTSLLLAAFGAPSDLDAEARKALSAKQGVPGWRAIGRLAVRAATPPRQYQLLGRLTAGLRLLQAPGVELGVRRTSTRSVITRREPLNWSLALNVKELPGALAMPLGDSPLLPVTKSTSRRLPATRGWSETGHVMAMGNYPGREIPLRVADRDALMHTWLLGPTGSGKSVLLEHCIRADLAAGRGCIVIEPKGDLVEAVLRGVPEERLDDVVVLDPTDPQPVGINPLQGRGNPELAVDGLLAVFKGLFGDAIGPRTHDVLAAGLTILARAHDTTLLDLPRLYVDRDFRRRLTHGINDPVALGPFLTWFEQLSEAEKQQVLAPLQNKLRQFLLRDAIRGVIGQREPRFEIADTFRQNKVLLVSLAKGRLGTEAAGLLGSLVFSEVWRAILARGDTPPEHRRPTFVYVDEFQDYLHVPTDLADLTSQSRSYGAGLFLSHQHVAQLSPTIRAAVLANARNRVTFAVGHDDAALLARGSRLLAAEDYEGLGRYEVYVQTMRDGQVLPPASGRTLPTPTAISDPFVVWERSRKLYGRALRDHEPTAATVDPRGASPIGRLPAAGGQP